MIRPILKDLFEKVKAFFYPAPITPYPVEALRAELAESKHRIKKLRAEVETLRGVGIAVQPSFKSATSREELKKNLLEVGMKNLQNKRLDSTQKAIAGLVPLGMLFFIEYMEEKQAQKGLPASNEISSEAISMVQFSKN